MEPAGAEVLSAEWVGAERKLRRRLRALPLGPADVDDVCQDTFVRLLRRADRLDGAHVVPLALVAGWNLALNVLRDRATRAVPVGDFPDFVAEFGIDQEVQWRLELERTLDVVATMSPADQSAVLRHLFGERGADKREQDRQALRLLRARARLKAKLGPVFAGLPVWRWRAWVVEWGPAATAAAATAVVVGMASLMPPSAPVQAPTTTELVSGGVVALPPSAAPTRAGTVVQATVAGTRTVEGPTRSTAESEAPSTQQPTLRLAGPPGTETGSDVHTSPRGPDDGLACVSAPHLGGVCVPHPLHP